MEELSMSVIFFGAEELGNLAWICVGGWQGSENEKHHRHYAECLAEYSKANAVAYRETYGKEADSVPLEEILRFQVTQAVFPDALRVAVLLHYNLIANNGREFGGPGVKAALISVLNRMLSLCQGKIESIASR
jgi:hypothetical protein